MSGVVADSYIYVYLKLFIGINRYLSNYNRLDLEVARKTSKYTLTSTTFNNVLYNKVFGAESLYGNTGPFKEFYYSKDLDKGVFSDLYSMLSLGVFG